MSFLVFLRIVDFLEEPRDFLSLSLVCRSSYKACEHSKRYKNGILRDFFSLMMENFGGFSPIIMKPKSFPFKEFKEVFMLLADIAHSKVTQFSK